ncbi:hypothetical protein CYLTODRAFT_451561 [Cylindrobasidium torrendii FP15055 ss-10]|uniref:Elongin-C n=1 Tax=Cylindrobasidium torrendii FP15055 ss-10 TaxID=1314674 RepID=A0A0D7BJK1_9AGAR|nr:hypothetical protein CYLTODRAFT_451561 [Cylindrobasidium torrendii FP15055 ss-10]
MTEDVEMNPPVANPWIRITSGDGFNFLVRKNVVMMSGTWKDSLDDSGKLKHNGHDQPMLMTKQQVSGKRNRMLLRRQKGAPSTLTLQKEIYSMGKYSAVIVEKLIEYMAFKAHYEKASGKEVPTNEFIDRIPPEIVLELLLAADYYAFQSPYYNPM